MCVLLIFFFFFIFADVNKSGFTELRVFRMHLVFKTAKEEKKKMNLEKKEKGTKQDEDTWNKLPSCCLLLLPLWKQERRVVKVFSNNAKTLASNESQLCVGARLQWRARIVCVQVCTDIRQRTSIYTYTAHLYIYIYTQISYMTDCKDPRLFTILTLKAVSWLSQIMSDCKTYLVSPWVRVNIFKSEKYLIFQCSLSLF